MLKRIVALLALLCALPAGPPAAVAQAPFKEHRTPGGLTFHYRFDDRTPFAALHFGWRDGFADRHKGKEGIITLFSAMVTQGADGSEGNVFSERLADLHASVSFASGWTATYGQVRAPGARLGEAVAAALDALAKAKPGDSLMRRLRERARGGEAQSLMRAETIASRTAMRALLGEHRWTRGLDIKRFDRIGPTELDLWRAERLGRSGLVLVASGALPADAFARIIDEAFAGLPERPELARIVPTPPKVMPQTLVVERPGTQTIIYLAAPMIVPDLKEAPKLSIANAILGGGSQGRLFKAVRGDLGATYGAGSSIVTVHRDQRIVVLQASVANDLAKASLAALRTTYAKWHADGVTDAELVPARERALSGVKGAWRDITSANNWLLGLLLDERPADDMNRHEERLRSLTRDELNGMIRSVFPPPDRFLTIIVTPKAEGFDADCVIRSDVEVLACPNRR
jgi:zinc protease